MNKNINFESGYKYIAKTSIEAMNAHKQIKGKHNVIRINSLTANLPQNYRDTQ